MGEFDLGENLTGIKLDILIGHNLLQELIGAICSGTLNLLGVVPAKMTGFKVSPPFKSWFWARDELCGQIAR